MRTRVVGAVAAVPFAVVAIRSLHNTWLATGDYSNIELRTRAVGTAHTPLVGPYSRFGWNHPGPAMFFALAAPYRLLAGHSHGLLLGAAIIAGVATITAIVAMLRVDQPTYVALYSVVVVGVLVRALGGGFLWDPWNPYIIVLPFLALVLLTWLAATGEPRALPVAVAFASFIAQTHVALAVEAVALLAVATAWLVATERTARLKRSMIVAAGVLAAMWLLPIYQEIRPGGRNLSELVQFWTTKHHDTVGFAQGARLLALQLSIPAPWISGHEHVLPFTASVTAPQHPVPYALILLLVAAVVAWRRRDRIAMAACSVALIATVAAWFSIASIVGSPFSYLLRWSWVVGALCWIASGVALLPPLGARLGATRSAWLTRVLTVGAAALLVAVTVEAWSAQPPVRTDDRVAEIVGNQAVPHLRGLREPILIEVAQGDYQAGSILGGVIVAAVEHGIDARYEPSASFRAGPERVVSVRHAGSRAIVAVGPAVAVFARDPAYREIARYDSLDPSERREYVRLDAALNRVVAKGSLAAVDAYAATHAADVHRLEALDERADTAAVFVRVKA